MIKKHAKDLIVLLIIAIVITVAILCVDIKTTEEYYAPTENQVEGNSTGGTEQETIEQAKFAYIEISCKSLRTMLDKGLIKGENVDKIEQIVPKDGVILNRLKVQLQKGDTAFSVLKRVAKENNITIEHDINSSYVRGIANVREFMGGKNSGWLIAVNGSLIPVGAGGYTVKENDVMSWNYTCDYTGG